MDILAAWIRTTFICDFRLCQKMKPSGKFTPDKVLCVSTTTAFQTCLYTSHCEQIVPTKGANIGHDEEEYCQILQETVCCFDYNKIKCQQDTLIQIDHYLNSLFRSNLPEYCKRECNDCSILGYSLFITIIGFILTQVFH